MMKKILLLALAPLTLSLHAAFIMEKNKPLTKIQVTSNNEDIPVLTTQEPSTTAPNIIEEDSTTLGKKIFEINFTRHPVGIYTVQMHEEDFRTYEGENLYYQNHDGSWMYGTDGPGNTVSIVEDENEKVLQVLYKKGEIHLGNSGFQSLAALPKNNRPKEDPYNPQEVTLIYYVKFKTGFHWTTGGKLPGLAGGIAPAGSAIIGSDRLNNGFSARFMFHKLTSSEGVEMPSSLIGYIYHPGREGTDGQSVYGAGSYMSTTKPTTSFTDRDKSNLFQFETNKWYKIQQTIKANTPNKSDGTMKVWINDQLATNYGNMKYIADGKHGKYSVDRLLFSTFYGGGTDDYKPTRDTYTLFKNIQVFIK